MLKNAGADLTIKDVNDDNIVFYSNYTMSVKYLVEQGIDINHINKEGHNALSTIDISNENEKPFLDQLILHGICYEIYGKTKKEWEDRGLSEELFNYIKPLNPNIFLLHSSVYLTFHNLNIYPYSNDICCNDFL